MASELTHTLPDPIINVKEERLLAKLTEEYERLTRPTLLRKAGEKAIEIVPAPVKTAVGKAKDAVEAQELYKDALDVIANGFQAIQEQAVRFSVSPDQVVGQINAVTEDEITAIEEICFARCYIIRRAVMKENIGNLGAAFVEGAGTGVFGFWGIPANLVLSTFLYFRAVQMVALYYGYDVTNDPDEMTIAGEVFANAMNPSKKEGGNSTGALIGKIMMASEMAAVKQAAAKGWADMAARGGAALLIAEMRALVHKSAQKALEKAGVQGLEKSIFRSVFEQIGRKLTLKIVQRAVPIVGGVVGALFDTGLMDKVLKYADIFYAKRFLLEKEVRCNLLLESEIETSTAEEL